MTVLFLLLILAGIVTALLIAFDVRRNPQNMTIMSITWPITGLYMPLFGWLVWRHLGKRTHHEQHEQHEQHEHAESHHDSTHQHGGSVSWRSAFISATHCGAGCVIGDIVAAPVAATLQWQLMGSPFLGHTAISFIAAFLIGILFQYLPMREMGASSRSQTVINAIKADTFSLIVFQAGMFFFLWLARGTDLFRAPDVTSVHFWGVMIIAMFIGYLLSVPANYFLIKRGIKHAM